jgi:hypothetical protein
VEARGGELSTRGGGKKTSQNLDGEWWLVEARGGGLTARGGAWQGQIYCRSLWQCVRVSGGSQWRVLYTDW